MRALSSQCIDVRVPSSFSRFLKDSQWDPYQININRMTYFQSLNQLKATDTGYIYIDDTVIKKTGKKIKSAGWHYSHSENKSVLGQDVVACQYRDDKKEYCLNFRTYLNKKLAKKRNVPFKTRIEMAMDMLEEIHDCGVIGQTVAMDSWFVTSDLIDKIKELGYHWVGRVKSNRICFNQGQRMNLKEYASLIPDSEWQEVIIPYKTNLAKNQPKTQFIASRSIQLQSLGEIKMVFIRPSLDQNTVLFLGTDWFDLNALKILEIYTGRWRIETFFRDSKQNIAFSQYLGRSNSGFVRYLCLVYISYSFIKYLTHMGFWGKHALSQGSTFGEQVDNYRQLWFEQFISIIYKLGEKRVEESQVIGALRVINLGHSKRNSQIINDRVFYHLQDEMLALAG